MGGEMAYVGECVKGLAGERMEANVVRRCNSLSGRMIGGHEELPQPKQPLQDIVWNESE